jgi:mRNA-degrading endonuclease RelE of RelBE toxin-antitoxin system
VKVFLSNTFKRTAKKLHRTHIKALEKAIDAIKNDPLLGELKKGDLAGIRVYKFHLSHQLILLSYDYNDCISEPIITLLSFGSHENFYTDLKKQLKQ